MSLPLPLARHAPGDLVFDGAAGALTAAALWRRAAGVAAALPEGCTRVVLACHDRALFAAGLLAAWHRGIPLVLPPHLSTPAIEALGNEPGAHVVHDQEGGLGSDARALVADEDAPLELRLGAQSLAALVYTSGSTGEPRAHPKTLFQLLREVQNLIECLELERARVVASVTPNHIYGLLFGVLVPLCGGGVAGRDAPLLPAAVERALSRLQADAWIAVPAHLRAVAEARDTEWLTRCRVFSSAAPLPPAVGQALRERHVFVCEILGSTETGGIARRQLTDGVWHPMPATRVTADSDGAMWVDSPWLHPDEPRPMRTQDRIEQVEDGFVHCGRADRVVKVAGRRVDLGAVEARIREIEGVSDARVVARAVEGARGQELWAAVQTHEVAAARVRRVLRERLDPVTVPRRIRCVPQLPRTTLGKVTDAGVGTLFETETWRLSTGPLPEGEAIRVDVPEGLGYFSGHFHGLPILPGVVQLHEVVRQARLRWPDLGALRHIGRAKFKAPLLPGDRCVLRLERKAGERVSYRLTRDGKDAATGTLTFGLRGEQQ